MPMARMARSAAACRSPSSASERRASIRRNGPAPGRARPLGAMSSSQTPVALYSCQSIGIDRQGYTPMSYCLAIRTASGLVFASDSRTHGGVDDVHAYSKMHRFEAFEDRVFVLLSAGNLSTTQAVLRRLGEGTESAAGRNAAGGGCPQARRRVSSQAIGGLHAQCRRPGWPRSAAAARCRVAGRAHALARRPPARCRDSV